MPDQTPSDNELFIHLDLDGLLALMKAAIATGRGRLELGSGSGSGAGGITAGTGTVSFVGVT